MPIGSQLTRPHARRAPLARRLLQALAIVAAIWAAGLLWFVGSLPAAGAMIGDQEIDGIVVLTGGRGRIRAGLEALAAGPGRRLLISGVNRQLANETILNAIGGEIPAELCCIDLGREARDTRGNAAEAAEWAAKHGFGSLLIITADYHMPRSMVEFRGKMRDVRLVAYAVVSRPSPLSLASEYNKYLFSVAQSRLSEKGQEE